MDTISLVFEDGTKFHGRIFAGKGERGGEVVFNTAMSGYQEVITDPSYAGQIVVMTYPLIGSYGINKADAESRNLFLEALLVKEYIDFPSNWQSELSLKEYLDKNNILGVEGFDTRAITKHIREKGAARALLTTSTDSPETIAKKVSKLPKMEGRNLVNEVTIDKSYTWNHPENKEFNVAVLDCGCKYNILNLLTDQGMACTVLPSDKEYSKEDFDEFDGVFISNGPGDPETVEAAISSIKSILEHKPIFGICLGHQILTHALGGKTFKLPFGHHGANHPVKNLKTGKIEITSQNHGFATDEQSLPEDVEISHINLNDNTVEGIRHKTLPVFSVQYHPESAPGPHDSRYLFDDFKALLKEHY